MKIHSLPVIGLLISVSLLSACAKKGATEDVAAPVDSGDSSDSGEANNQPGKDPAQGQIRIGPKIAKACGIEATDTFFAYNSSKMSEDANKVLQAVAVCFTTGPLQGETLRIVGHADPRGDEEYNMVLGGKRSDTVAGFMKNSGMSDDKLETTSRGETEATGTDEESWKLDRKVELFLAE